MSKEKLKKTLKEAFEERRDWVEDLRYDITQKEYEQEIALLDQAEKQIKSLIENQPEVDEEFVEKWAKKLPWLETLREDLNKEQIQDNKKLAIKMLLEAGVKIK